MTIPEAAVQWALRIADDKKSGYSQSDRWGPNFDCSSFCVSAYKMGAGLPINTSVVNYTGNLDKLTQYGFKDVTKKVNFSTCSGMKRGDIVYYHKSGNIGHAVLYLGNGKIVHARGQSYGSPKTGDQGTEIAVTTYYKGSFNKVLRYEGTAEVKPAPAPAVKRYAVSAQMPIIKYGSVSKAVKVWQTIIGVEADGEFGRNTLAATLQFQRASSLEDDGEVGPLTWSAGLSII